MANGELKDMEYFFSTLSTHPSFDTEAYKTSVVGESDTNGERRWRLSEVQI